MNTTHAELTGLITGYIVEQSILNNVDVDHNNIISEIDNFLADYADAYGLVEFNEQIAKNTVAFMNGKLLLSYKIDTSKVLDKVNVFFNNLELSF